MAPASPGSDRRSRLAELSRQGPLMDPELAGHDRERRALLVPRGRKSNGFVGHLADHRRRAPPAWSRLWMTVVRCTRYLRASTSMDEPPW